ncbi:NADPH-dependent diflavin oxidoreductase 1 [Podosphaera aphanis]|nr:NADPH-dependent diflavin oxidoreductase 1 [Podosphaera aphanis]
MTENISDQRHGRTALIIFGSETGNSEEVAEQLGCLLERLHFLARISEMNDVKINELWNYSVVILITSTTGQGEFPANACNFWRNLLRKRLPPGYLNHVKYTTFGLGDSSYPKFNVSARKLHKRLLQLGANEIYPPGEADDQHPEGIDGTYLPWSNNLYNLLVTSYPLPEGLSPIPSESFLPPKYHLQIDEDHIGSLTLARSIQATNDSHYQNCSKVELSLSQINPAPEIAYGTGDALLLETDASSNGRFGQLGKSQLATDNFKETTQPLIEGHIPLPDGYIATLESNTRMTPDDHFQDVRELIFTLKNSPLYEPGDSIIIYPQNFPEDVNTLINLMDWQGVADKPLKFVPDYPEYYGEKWLITTVSHLHPIPHSTLRQLLTHNLDITAIPKRRFFEIIAQHTDNSLHRERLLEFANPVFTDEFYDYTSRPRRSILEVLLDFPTVKLPWRYATSIFPIIRGRNYSIASGGVEKLEYTVSGAVTNITILVAIVKYRTVLKKIRQGLCSRYIASLNKKTQIQIEFKKSGSFYKLAREFPQFPLILVAPGTGIAPCRSLIFERKELKYEYQRRNPDFTVGYNFLFFGCRNRKADFFYEEDWKSQKLQTNVYPAFSRDKLQKIYVQDIIRQEAELVATLILREEAIIYVCGSSGNMPKSVREAFIYALTSCENVEYPGVPFTRESAIKQLEVMEKSGRYIQETW